MKFNENKIVHFANDLINLFTDYAFSLEHYFKDEKNKKEHIELYNEYQILNLNLRKLKGKYRL